ncbi:MAG: hypothetical protein ACLTHQ_08800 [Odoribacter splanchnicus]
MGIACSGVAVGELSAYSPGSGCCGGGLLAGGLQKGDRVALLSEDVTIGCSPSWVFYMRWCECSPEY